jgi:hypothetical protein
MDIVYVTLDTGTVGVPEITPVVGLITKPAGKLGFTVNVSDPEPAIMFGTIGVIGTPTAKLEGILGKIMLDGAIPVEIVTTAVPEPKLLVAVTV